MMAGDRGGRQPRRWLREARSETVVRIDEVCGGAQGSVKRMVETINGDNGYKFSGTTASQSIEN